MLDFHGHIFEVKVTYIWAVLGNVNFLPIKMVWLWSGWFDFVKSNYLPFHMHYLVVIRHRKILIVLPYLCLLLIPKTKMSVDKFLITYRQTEIKCWRSTQFTAQRTCVLCTFLAAATCIVSEKKNDCLRNAE